jgi:hypothetical protein
MATSGAEGREGFAPRAGGEAGPPRTFVLAGATLGLGLLALGVVLWSQRGQAVFVDLLSSALALCF